MAAKSKTSRQFQAENDSLRRELAEALETIEAIRRGHTDAILVDDSSGPKVYMLDGSDQPYRIMVEEMQEGAMALREDGLISYCNEQMARMLRTSHQNLLGKSFQSFLTPANQALFEAMLRASRDETNRSEVVLAAADGAQVPALLAIRVLSEESPRLISAVVSDLTEQKRRREIAASEAFSSSILDQAADAVVVCELNGRIIRANQAAHKLCGGNPLLLPFHGAFPLRYPSEPRWIDSASNRPDQQLSLLCLTPTTGVLRGVEAALPSADGCRDLLLNAGPLRDANGSHLGCIITMTDITERKLAAKKLAESEALLRAVLDGSPDPIYMKDRESRLLLANPAAFAVIGRPAEECLGKSDELFYYNPADGRAIMANDRRIMTAGRTETVEETVNTPAGPRWYLSTKAPCRDAAGNINGLIGVSRDITEYKRAEAALRESEARYRMLHETMRDAFVQVDMEGRIIECNDVYCQMLGYSPEEIRSLTYQQLTPDRWHDFEAALVRDQIIARGYSDVYEKEYLRKDGTVFPAELRTVLARDAAGQPAAMWGIVRDITARKQAEQAVRAAEELARQRLAELEDLYQNAPVGLCVLDRDLRFLRINERLAAINGFAPAHHIGKTVRELMPQLADKVETGMRRVLETGEPNLDIEIVSQTPAQAGVQRSWMEQWLPVEDGDGKVIGLSIVVEETTARKQTEAALRKVNEQLEQQTAKLERQRRRFFDMLETLPVMICQMTPDYQVRFVNRAFREKNGELNGRRCYEYCFGLDKPCEFCESFVPLKTGRPHRWEFVAPNGAIIDAYDFPFTDADGMLGILAMDIDITERRKAAEALANAKATAEAANRGKSRFLANMSHELRTPMNAILGMIDVALLKATDPTVRDCLQTAKGSADLLLTLLNDLLDSSKIESGKLELESAPFSLRRMMDQITRVLSVRASEKGLAFYCRIPEQTPDAVVGDRTRLQQVLLNLAGNAIKFTERGDVEIRVCFSPCLLAGEGAVKLEFAVRDTGIGIPPAGIERLFRPFGQADASMSRRFGGTGLGLSISKSLVELMGGRITVESELDKGSTFYFNIQLPLAKELPPDFEAPVAVLPAPDAPLSVLLVEDNPANQKLATYILQDRGHVVHAAGNGQEAIRLTAQNRYDVILMDVQMPGMNGLEAATAIRTREASGSRMPIIAMTAHAMQGDRERCLAAGMDGYLSKPVNAQEMIGLVEKLARNTSAAPQAAVETPKASETNRSSDPVVFDPDEAVSRCFDNKDVARDMIRYFFKDVDSLFPQMREALAAGDLVEVGRLGHRLKGTVVYLAACRAQEAAVHVERFVSGKGSPAEAEQAVDALHRECLALKTVLTGHPLAAEPT